MAFWKASVVVHFQYSSLATVLLISTQQQHRHCGYHVAIHCPAFFTTHYICFDSLARNLTHILLLFGSQTELSGCVSMLVAGNDRIQTIITQLEESCKTIKVETIKYLHALLTEKMDTQ